MSTETITSKSDTPVTIDNIEQASSNFYWTYETVNGVFNLQTTIRGILSFDQIQAHIKSVLEANAHIVTLGGLAKGAGKFDNPNASELPKPTPVEQVLADVANNDPLWVPTEASAAPSAVTTTSTSEDTFITELLVCNISGGKKYFKVKGKPWMKYGVTVWDEVLVSAGIPVGKLEGQEYKLEGYKATFVRKPDGNPQKVTKLEKVA